MSFNSDFECFVHLYDTKYKITLTENHHGYVRFSQLYPKIQQIDPKQDINFETNTFEIFDYKENRFKRIESFNEIIINNSRVRVLIKPQVFKNYLFDSNGFNNSYKTVDNHTSGMSSDLYSDKSRNNAINGNHFTDNYTNKSGFNSNDGRVWEQTSGSSVRDRFDGHSMRSLMSPSIVSAVEPSVMATTSTAGQSDCEWKTTYCPKVVDYSSVGSNSDLNLGSNDNYYQTVSPTPVIPNPEPNRYQTIDYILNKLIESRNIVLKEQTIEELKREGIEVKQNFNFETYLCKVCDECFQTSESAIAHSRSIEHLDQKFGKYADELDRSLVIPTENITDIKVVLARKQELKKLDLKTKYEFLRHGIRVKDGMGADAYVCIECKVTLMSYNYVRHHLSKFKTAPEQQASDVVYSSNTFFRDVSESRPQEDYSRQMQTKRNSGSTSYNKPESHRSNRALRRAQRRTQKRAEAFKMNQRLNPEPNVTPNKKKKRRRRRNRSGIQESSKPTENRGRGNGSSSRSDGVKVDVADVKPKLVITID